MSVILEAQVDALRGFLKPYRRLFVITGAGCSAPSGIDTYRDHAGEWQRPAPIQHQEFLRDESARRRYWARSMHGWPLFSRAEPNAAHLALASIERRIQLLVTQNVDGLHQRAGQAKLQELHGSLSEVRCLSCGVRQPRLVLQTWLESHNARFLRQSVEARPDGDAELVGVFDNFQVPVCQCGGILKPDVVFYGDSVPLERVAAVRRELARSDALLVVGSSLMVYSSYRFVREARSLGLPLAAINLGTTRADDWFDIKLEADCVDILPRLIAENDRRTMSR